MAEEFGIIMKALWTGQYRYISPKDFKMTIGKINDQFAGYSQQDSQEMLLFLMDGLHEDLNKVSFIFGSSVHLEGTELPTTGIKFHTLFSVLPICAPAHTQCILLVMRRVFIESGG